MRPGSESTSSAAEMERLQKFLSRAGVASRRKSEEMISLGMVEVNGETVTKPGRVINPRVDEVRVDGERVKVKDTRVCFAFNKPKEVITSMVDPEGRKTVRDFTQGIRESVYPVGRLDYHSEGLLLLTNDGDLSNRITHPKFGIPKTYEVKVKRRPTTKELGQLRKGMLLEEGFVRPISVDVVSSLAGGKCLIKIVLKDGRNREIRRLFEKIRIHVDRLKRVAIGSFELGKLPKGKMKRLTKEDIELLTRAIDR
jgi:23S rRNA pseudouridine2605 synthase